MLNRPDRGGIRTTAVDEDLEFRKFVITERKSAPKVKTMERGIVYCPKIKFTRGSFITGVESRFADTSCNIVTEYIVKRDVIRWNLYNVFGKLRLDAAKLRQTRVYLLSGDIRTFEFSWSGENKEKRYTTQPEEDETIFGVHFLKNASRTLISPLRRSCFCFVV